MDVSEMLFNISDDDKVWFSWATDSFSNRNSNSLCDKRTTKKDYNIWCCSGL